ncbi:MAG: hypothetical protein JRF71_05620 [Deltaproteobacteria bacterium]|nr:hypothetical protein [Deltaproteobacteria bacterium]MBW2200299.1 hypothetical protein [Deltaproteobacteria bacterium]
MGYKNGSSESEDVIRHLDDFFSEGIEFPSDMRSVKEGSPIRELQAVILAIDWEINDEIMTGLIEQIGRLKEVFKKEKILLLFLQLLGSVGKYIKTKKANVHPDAIQLLNSVYASFENVFLSKYMPQDEKKKILISEVEKFNRLKEQLANRKAEAEKKEDVFPEEKRPSDISQMTSNQALTYALEEIKQVIKAEFKALRAELKL